MIMPTQLNTIGKIKVLLPSGGKIDLSLYSIVFKKWTGELLNFNYGRKPVINYEGRPVFAELAILKLFTSSGWNGVWVETYGGTHFLKDMPEDWKLTKHHLSIPEDKEVLLKNIWKTGKTTSCFDIFVWKDKNIIFCESKHKDKDRLTNAQTKFIEGALACGVPKESLLIIEWEFK